MFMSVETDFFLATEMWYTQIKGYNFPRPLQVDTQLGHALPIGVEELETDRLCGQRMSSDGHGG
jgi:hypothetical protein